MTQRLLHKYTVRFNDGQTRVIYRIVKKDFIGKDNKILHLTTDSGYEYFYTDWCHIVAAEYADPLVSG